jgi:transcriptional repressor of cell division inhibition gene dicB
MTTEEAISHYGTQVRLAQALGTRQSTISSWGIYPPKLRQLQLQQITKGRLKAEPGILEVKRRAA